MNAPLICKSAADDVVWFKRDAIVERAALLESFAISLREAAWRGSDVTVEVTLGEMRETLIDAIQIHRGVEAPRVDREAAE